MSNSAYILAETLRFENEALGRSNNIKSVEPGILQFADEHLLTMANTDVVLRGIASPIGSGT